MNVTTALIQSSPYYNNATMYISKAECFDFAIAYHNWIIFERDIAIIFLIGILVWEFMEWYKRRRK